MALKDDLIAQVKKTFREKWETKEGNVVPSDKDIPLRNYGVYLDAVCLYADMIESTKLVEGRTPEFAAECYKVFLHCASRIIKENGGDVVAFDGDRVMGVFVTGTKNTNAMQAALKINYAVDQIINPELKSFYIHSDYVLRHCVGIDGGKILVTGTGIRTANDFVWVGKSANYAAKLCNLRVSNLTSWVTADVYNAALDVAKLYNGAAMWSNYSWSQEGNRSIYGSNWYRAC